MIDPTKGTGLTVAQWTTATAEMITKAAEEEQRRQDRGRRMNPGQPRREALAGALALGLLDVKIP